MSNEGRLGGSMRSANQRSRQTIASFGGYSSSPSLCVIRRGVGQCCREVYYPVQSGLEQYFRILIGLTFELTSRGLSQGQTSEAASAALKTVLFS